MPYKQWHEDLDEIKRRCRRTGQLFEDPEFPAIDSKVFKKRVLPGGQSFDWLRPQVKELLHSAFNSAFGLWKRASIFRRMLCYKQEEISSNS